MVAEHDHQKVTYMHAWMLHVNSNSLTFISSFWLSLNTEVR
jgi:hypothetical protein